MKSTQQVDAVPELAPLTVQPFINCVVSKQLVDAIPELTGKRNLRIGEAAQYLGLGRSKVYELISSGRLKSLKLDAARRVPVWAIQEFLTQHDGSGAV